MNSPCCKCNDTGEIKKPVSDYIREIDVKTGHAERPIYTTVFCTCRVGRTKERTHEDKKFD